MNNSYSQNRTKSFFIAIGCTLFFMMLVFPYQYMWVKIMLIGTILLSFLLNDKFLRRITLLNRYRKWIFVYFFMNLFYLLYAYLKGNPGANSCFTVFICWPILYFLYCLLIDDISIKYLFKVTYIAYVVFILVGLYVFFQYNNYVPQLITPSFWGINDGERPLFAFRTIQGGSIVSFIFLFPFYLTMYLVDEKFSKSKFNGLILLLSFIYLFATSRRAIILSLLYLPFIIYYFFKRSFTRKDAKKTKHFLKKMYLIFGIPILFIVVFAIYLGFFDISEFSTFIFSAFNQTDVNYSNERSTQAISLINGWLDNPLFGAGPGINVDVVRSDVAGGYELTYLAILFSRGVFGFSIYCFQVLMLIFWGVKIIKNAGVWKSYLTSYLVAFLSFLISNASNPYLDAYDHLWIIFLFISLQNVILKSKYEKE